MRDCSRRGKTSVFLHDFALIGSYAPPLASFEYFTVKNSSLLFLRVLRVLRAKGSNSPVFLPIRRVPPAAYKIFSTIVRREGILLGHYRAVLSSIFAGAKKCLNPKSNAQPPKPPLPALRPGTKTAPSR